MLQECDQPAKMVNPKNLQSYLAFFIFRNINSNAACFGQFFTLIFLLPYEVQHKVCVPLLNENGDEERS